MTTPAQRQLILAFRAELARMEPEMRRAYARAWQWLQVRMTEEVMLARLQRGLPLTDLIPYAILDRAFAPVQSALQRGEAIGFTTQTRLLTRGGAEQTMVGVRFDSLSQRVLAAAKTLDAKILATAKAEVRESVRQFVQAGLEAGRNPRDIARTMREVVGLAPNHEEHIRNYRRKLTEIGNTSTKMPSNELRDKRFDATLKKAIRDNAPLSSARIDAQVAAYTRKYTAWHAETVARTATLNAFRQGQATAIDAMVDFGLVERVDMFKAWTTVGDDRVREEHVDMEGETVPLDQPFSNGLYEPNEWNCRCVVTYDFRPAGSRSRDESIAIMRQRGRLAA